MSKPDRFTRDAGWIDLLFVERERTLPASIEKTIRYHLAVLSLRNIVILTDESGDSRSQTATHDWVQKAGLELESGRSPARVALDQTMIRVNDELYWLYAEVNPETN